VLRYRRTFHRLRLRVTDHLCVRACTDLPSDTDRSATVAADGIPRGARASGSGMILRTVNGSRVRGRFRVSATTDEDDGDGDDVLSARRHAEYCFVDCSALVSRRRAARPAMRRALHLRNDREPVRRPPAAACLPPFLEGEKREERKVVRTRWTRSALADLALVRASCRADRDRDLRSREPNRALKWRSCPRVPMIPLLPAYIGRRALTRSISQICCAINAAEEGGHNNCPSVG